MHEAVDGLLEVGGEVHDDPGVDVVLHARRHRDDERFQGGGRRHDDLPGPQDVLRPGHEVTRWQVIGRALGQPVGQPGPRRLVKRLPTQICSHAVHMLGLGGQPSGHFSKEDQRKVQLPRPIMRDCDRSRGGLGEEAAIGPQGTKLHGETPALSLTATAPDFGAITFRERPVLEEFLGTGIIREHEGRRPPAGEGTRFRRGERTRRRPRLDASRGWHQGAAAITLAET